MLWISSTLSDIQIRRTCAYTRSNPKLFKKSVRKRKISGCYKLIQNRTFLIQKRDFPRGPPLTNHLPLSLQSYPRSIGTGEEAWLPTGWKGFHHSSIRRWLLFDDKRHEANEAHTEGSWVISIVKPSKCRKIHKIVSWLFNIWSIRYHKKILLWQQRKPRLPIIGGQMGDRKN